MLLISELDLYPDTSFKKLTKNRCYASNGYQVNEMYDNMMNKVILKTRPLSEKLIYMRYQHGELVKLVDIAYNNINLISYQNKINISVSSDSVLIRFNDQQLEIQKIGHPDSIYELRNYMNQDFKTIQSVEKLVRNNFITL